MYDVADFIYYRLPWLREYDLAIGEGVMAAIDIHGGEVEAWLVDYYVAQAHRDRTDRQYRDRVRL